LRKRKPVKTAKTALEKLASVSLLRSLVTDEPAVNNLMSYIRHHSFDYGRVGQFVMQSPLFIPSV
jgi:TusA-related sulfurtransferase